MKEERGLQVASAVLLIVTLGVFASGCYFLQTPARPVEDSVEEIPTVESLPELTVSEVFEEIFEIEAEEEVVPLSREEATARTVGWTWETPLSLTVETKQN